MMMRKMSLEWIEQKNSICPTFDQRALQRRIIYQSDIEYDGVCDIERLGQLKDA